ncbi:hypothetical protein P7K49_023416, partial [Saguinus oedipus]
MTSPVAWGPAFLALGQARTHSGSAFALGDGSPSFRDRRQGAAISEAGQGGARLRKAAEELQGRPGRSPRIPRILQACSEA